MKTGLRILEKTRFLIIFIIGFIMLFIQQVWADAAVPSLSDSVCIRTYPLSTGNNTYVYTTSSLTTRGTTSPKRAYNAVIYASDEIYIYSMDSKSAYISYPTSSGRKYGYIQTNAVTTNNYSQDARTSNAKITTYKRAGGSVYGNIAKGDTVYAVAQSGNYTQVIYPVGSNYKMGWIATSSYERYINANASSGNNPHGYLDSVTSDTNNTISVNGWAFDKDNLSASLTIYVYVGGSAGSSASRHVITANTHRSDVNNAFPGVGSYHGFSSVINVSQTGTQAVYVYAANIGGGADVLLGSSIVNIKGDNNNQPRSSVVSYMNSMASIAWTPNVSFKHWSYGKNDGNNHIWSAGTTYYGIPYSQNSRETALETFQSKLSGMRYVGPSGQSTYMGNDCSSAVSMAYRKVNESFPVTNTTGLYPVRRNTKKVGGYNNYNSTSSTYICNKNGKSAMKQSYQLLQAGDLLLTNYGNPHVMMVTGVGNGYVTVTHQTTYKSSLHSTWRINEKWSFDSLYSSKHIPVTMASW